MGIIKTPKNNIPKTTKIQQKMALRICRILGPIGPRVGPADPANPKLTAADNPFGPNGPAFEGVSKNGV